MPEPVSGNKNTSPTVGTQVVIQDTLAGDANLDGNVNITDLSTLLLNYNKTGTFASGDFNGDGAVNITDLSSLLLNYNGTLNPATPTIVYASREVFDDPAAIALLNQGGFRPLVAVPEPSTLAVLALSATALAGRRRRR